MPVNPNSFNLASGALGNVSVSTQLETPPFPKNAIFWLDASGGGKYVLRDPNNRVTAWVDSSTLYYRTSGLGLSGIAMHLDISDAVLDKTSNSLLLVDRAGQTIKRLSGPLLTKTEEITAFGDGALYPCYTIAGSPLLSGFVGGESGAGAAIRLNSRFCYPTSLTTDTSGNIYVADTRNHLIRIITTNNAVSSFAGLVGNFAAAIGSNDTNRINVNYRSGGRLGSRVSTLSSYNDIQFNFPHGIVCDSRDNIIVSDTYNFTLTKLSQPTLKTQPADEHGYVTTLAGISGVLSGTGADGINQPLGPCGLLSIDRNDNIYTTLYSTPYERYQNNLGVIDNAAFGNPVDSKGYNNTREDSLRPVSKILSISATNGHVKTLLAFNNPQYLELNTIDNVAVGQYIYSFNALSGRPGFKYINNITLPRVNIINDAPTTPAKPTSMLHVGRGEYFIFQGYPVQPINDATSSIFTFSSVLPWYTGANKIEYVTFFNDCLSRDNRTTLSNLGILSGNKLVVKGSEPRYLGAGVKLSDISFANQYRTNNILANMSTLTSYNVLSGEWKDFSLSFTNIAAISTNDVLFTAGVDYASGRGSGSTSISRNTLTPLTGNWQSVSVGGSHMFAISTNGTAFCTGLQQYGALGDGRTTGTTSLLTPITGDFTKIVCTIGNTFALSTNGTLWATGLNNCGQCGLTPTQFQPLNNFVTLFRQIPGTWYDIYPFSSPGAGPSVAYSSITNVVAISATDNLQKTTKVFVWGYNNEGNLGVGYGGYLGSNNIYVIDTPTPLSGDWDQVANLGTGIMAVSANTNKVFVAGRPYGRNGDNYGLKTSLLTPVCGDFSGFGTISLLNYRTSMSCTISASRNPYENTTNYVDLLWGRKYLRYFKDYEIIQVQPTQKQIWMGENQYTNDDTRITFCPKTEYGGLTFDYSSGTAILRNGFSNTLNIDGVFNGTYPQQSVFSVYASPTKYNPFISGMLGISGTTDGTSMLSATYFVGDNITVREGTTINDNRPLWTTAGGSSLPVVRFQRTLATGFSTSVQRTLRSIFTDVSSKLRDTLSNKKFTIIAVGRTNNQSENYFLGYNTFVGATNLGSGITPNSVTIFGAITARPETKTQTGYYGGLFLGQNGAEIVPDSSNSAWYGVSASIARPAPSIAGLQTYRVFMAGLSGEQEGYVGFDNTPLTTLSPSVVSSTFASISASPYGFTYQYDYFYSNYNTFNDIEVFVGGVGWPVSTQNISIPANANNRIGSRDLEIAELIVYDKFLTASELAKLRQYITQKYGLASLQTA